MGVQQGRACVALRRGSFKRLKTRNLFARHAEPLAFFNQPPVRLRARADKTDGHAAFAGAAGAANAVGVVDRRARQVVVHHYRQLRNVQAARGHVGRHHDLDRLHLEILQDLVAFALAQLAMKGLGFDVGLAQLVRDDLGGVLGGDKDQNPIPAFALHQVAQQLGAPGGVHFNGALDDVGLSLRAGLCFNAQRLVQHALGQYFNGGGKGGREEEVLPLRRQQLKNAAQLIAKPHVEQAIGFVKHQRADRVQRQRIVLNQVNQAARRCDHDVGAAAQLHHLRVDRHAAKDRLHLDPPRQVSGQGDDGLGHLGRQLARGHQHQPPDAARRVNGRLGQPLQHGQGKGCCLSGAGLGRSHDIAPLQDRRNRLALNRGGRCIALFSNGTQKRG